MPRSNIAPDYSVSRVIRGGWQISSGHTPGQPLDRQQAVDDTLAFIREGITTLDFGDIYLGVEETIGESLRQLRHQYGNDARAMVQLHTKYVPDLSVLPEHSFTHVERIIDRSRDRLGVEMLDLVQFHWWDYRIPGYVDAMLHLQRLQEQGKIRSLGVTNFDVAHMRAFAEAGVTPATAQVQYSVLDGRPAGSMTDFCAEHGVSMLCYGTVAGGFLSEKYLGIPEPKQPFPNRSLTKYTLIIDAFGGWDLFQHLLRVLKNVADKHHANIGTIASAYVLQRPQVAAVIVGARDRKHLPENLQIASLRLDAEDIEAIELVTRMSSGPSGEVYGLERDDPKHSSIMHTSNNAK